MKVVRRTADAPETEMTETQKILTRIREIMERRVARLLNIEEPTFNGLAVNLSLADLLNGIFLLEGQNETIGAYVGAMRFLSDIVGREELFNRPEPKMEPITEQTAN